MHHFQKISGFRGLTDRFYNHIEGTNSSERGICLPGVDRILLLVLLVREDEASRTKLFESFSKSASVGGT